MRQLIAPVSAVISVAALAIGGALPAKAQTGRPRSTSSSVTSQPTELFGLTPAGVPRPDQCNADTGRCLVAFIGYDHTTGALEGTQINAGSLSINLQTGQGWATSMGQFTGTVRGCQAPGSVTFRYDMRMGVEPGKNVGTFTVVESSGIGGLSGLTGGGSIVAALNIATGVVTGEGIARLKCDRS